MKENNIQDKLYLTYLIGFFIILALPILEWPPYFFPPDWGKTIAFKILFSVLLFLFLYQVLWRKTPGLFSKVKKISLQNISFWFLIILFAVYFLATIFSADIRFSLFGSPYRGGGFISYGFYILFAAISFLIIKEKDWQKLWDFSILIGVLVSFVALISYFGLFSSVFISQKDQLTSTLGGPSILGLYILILAFPTLGFAIKEKNRVKKILYFLSFLLFCWIILLTISQGAYLGLGVGALYFLFFYPAKEFKKSLYAKLGIVILLTLAVVSILFVKYHPENSLNKNYLFQTLSNWHMDQSRISAWKVSWQAFLHRPILGYGPENFSVGFDKYYDPSLPLIQRSPNTFSSWWDRPHNFILNILSDAGILGLISFSLLFGFIFFQLYKIEDKLIGHGLQGALVAYFADTFFNFDSFSSFIILFLIIGYSMSLIIKEQPEKSAENYRENFIFKNKKVVIAFSFLLLIYFIWFLNIVPLKVNAQINKAQYFSDEKNCDQALTIMDKTTDQHSIIDGYLRLKYVDFLRQCSNVNPENELAYAKKGIDLMKENINLIPNYTRNWLILGAFENVLIAAETNPENKKLLIDETEKYFQKAYELSPKRQEVFIEWIKKDLVSGDYQKALDKSQICINLNQKLPECYWLRGVTQIYLNKIDDAKKSLQLSIDNGFDGNQDIASLNQLANAYAFSKNYAELVTTYEKIVVISDLPQYRASLAFAYREIGQYKKAREMALIFLKLMPEAKNEVDAFLRTLPQ